MSWMGFAIWAWVSLAGAQEPMPTAPSAASDVVSDDAMGPDSVELATDPSVGVTVPWYVGMPVSLVSLVAADGGLPPEYLEPLLRVRQGRLLSPGDLREDISLLYRAAAFAAVEAEVEPWVATDDTGALIDAVRVSYVLVPPATVSSVKVEGPAGPARRMARRSLGVHKGEAIFPEDDLPLYRARVGGALAEAGWSESRVDLRSTPDGERLEALVLTVDPGEPRRYGTVHVLGDILEPASLRCRMVDLGARFSRRVERRPDCGISERQMRRWLRREGVSEGARVETGQLEEALVNVRRKLVRRGWLQSRIGFHIGEANADGDLSRTINVEGGPRLVLAVDRKRSFRERLLPTAGQLQETLGLYGGERMDDLTVEEATARLEDWFDRKGYLAAAVELDAEPVPGGVKLNVVVDSGRKHRLSRIEVTGANTFPPSFISGAMREAAVETLGDKKVSRAGISRGLEALEGVYRGAGHLDAVATFEGLLPPNTFEPWLFRRRRTLRTGIRIRIQEGPRTTLVSLSIDDHGGMAGAAVARATSELQGQPFNPGRLEALERELTGIYQALGYLNAETEIDVDVDSEGQEARARLSVLPGAQVRLRSVVVRGNRRTRRKVVTRELTLELGEPITPQAIADSRSNLYELGLFRVVSPELLGDDDRTRDLIIHVEERKNILLEGGGRVASDQGAVATARATHRNIGGLGHSLNLTGQLGYGWLGDEWRIDTLAPVWRVATRYTAPWVPGRGHDLIVEGLVREVAQEPTFRLQRSGLRFGIRSRFGDKVETFANYNAQIRQLENLDPGALVSGDPWLPLLGLDNQGGGELTVPSQNRVQTGPEILLLVDGRNDRFNPTQGAYLSVQGQLVDKFQSESVMFRGDLRLETFVGLGPIVVNWFGRVAGGRAAGDGNTLPIEDRYYLGGAGSMRGFRLNTVGPANFSSRPNLNMPTGLDPAMEGKALRNAPGHWVWTGGDSLFQTTLELRIPFTALGLSDWDGTNFFVFSDVGQVQLLDDAVVTSSTARGLNRPYRYGVGAGIRVATPIGPAAIALGVNPEPIGAWEEPRILPHITLGEL
ncbi:MAG: hypothetical protein CL927_14920 [Deltaproteobacteria bacterium]|nr:hypothetical protein [Deltaproteobacteria bacterium]HCH64962.1 hypothetical protein [Deltaproteobacteria bacterium]